MKTDTKRNCFRNGMVAMAVTALASTQLAGCPGMPLPPVPVSFDLVLGVEIPAIVTATGSADVALDEVCALFNATELEMLVREVAGDIIGDNLDITRVELTATRITATEGTFEPFTTAALDVTIPNSGGEVLLLGTAAFNDGLGTRFQLKLEDPVDLLNDLDESECSAPTLHLDGAGFLEGGDITFDVKVFLRVHTQIAK